jgi:hypothetical protein
MPSPASKNAFLGAVMASPALKNGGHFQERVTPSPAPKNIFPETGELL